MRVRRWEGLVWGQRLRSQTGGLGLQLEVRGLLCPLDVWASTLPVLFDPVALAERDAKLWLLVQGPGLSGIIWDSL